MLIKDRVGRLIGASFVLAALLLAAAAGAAEERGQSTAGALRKQRQAISDQIKSRSAGQEANDREDQSVHSSAAANGETLTLLRSLDALFVQHEALLGQRHQLEDQLKEAERNLNALDEFAPDEPKPYSFLLLDSLQDQLTVEKDRQHAIKADVKSAERLLQAAHDELNAAAGAGHNPADEAPEKPRPERQDEAFTPGDLAVALPREKVAVNQLAIEIQKLRMDVCKTTQKQIAKKIEVIEKDVTFSAQDRDEQLQRLVEDESDLKRRRQHAQARLQQVEYEREAELRELADKKSPQKVIDAALDAWRVAGDAYQTEIVLFDQQIESYAEIRTFWKRRYELATRSVEPHKLSRWLDDLDEFVDQLGDTSGALEHRRDAVNDQALAARNDPKGDDQEQAKWKDLRAASLQELREQTALGLADIKSTQRTLKRFRGELKAKLKENPENWQNRVSNAAKSFLGYKVAQDDEQAVTVGRVVLLLAYIIAGVIVAYCVGRLAGRLLIRLGMHRGTADALKSIMFNTLCIIFGVVSFQMLNIPLAAFAFVGGAAAIAIGFGGQDIMNNFMSGIILLTEQPIRVGDVIQLDDVQGVVLHIGLRSTQIQTQANHELIVPNKTLLDEQVMNLTLSDNLVQTFVTVTLDRAVPVQPAKLKMHEAVFAHPLVIKSPRPVVLLKEFDPYWSTFEVNFWIEYASFMKCAIVQSQVLEAISEFFPEAESTFSSQPAPDDANPPITEATAEKNASVSSPKSSSAMILRQLKRTSNKAARIKT